jgi:hypothetical protein
VTKSNEFKTSNHQKGDLDMKPLFLILCVIAVVFWVNHTAMAADNSAVEFFGSVADGVVAPDSKSLGLDGKALTMEAWVFPTAPQAGDGTIICKEDAYEMALRNGDLFMFAIQAGAWDWFGGGKPTMNEWHHLAVTYDGTTTQGWIDGKAAPSPTKVNNLPLRISAAIFQIGRRECCGTTPIKGIIDEVRISDVVRYTKDFPLPKTEFEPDKNTRLLWHLNEGAGGEVKDASGNKNTGKVDGKPKWTKGPPLGAAPVEPGGKLTTMWGRIKSPY